MDPSLRLSNLQISAALEDVIRLGIVFFKTMRNGVLRAELTREIAGLSEELRGTLQGREISSLPAVHRTRRLFHRVGIDPTKHRPSSEKLLRRVMQGKELPRINDFVDAMNLTSLRHQFPLGLYDWDALAPPVLVRVGSPGEGFINLSGDETSLEGRIVLVDGEGAFGNPTQDSGRSRIRERTIRSLVVLFAPADTARSELQEGIDDVVRAAESLCEAEVAVTGIIP